MQYQSFPGMKGGSESHDKLIAFRLPDLTGRKVLDVGCNEGYFCGYAHFAGASSVVGMDRSKEAIERASVRFPECRFLNQSWDSLPEDEFDLILLASALHYAEDQAELIHRLMGRLAPGGTFVLEVGIASSNESEWVLVDRSIDQCYFPSRSKLGEILQDYAWKIIGHSVKQQGDPVQRYVVHIKHMRPFAYLLMGTPGTGKSTIGRQLFGRADVHVVSGDGVFQQVANGAHEVSDLLRETISENFTTGTIDKTTERVYANGLIDELVHLWITLAGERDFAVDSFVPEKYQDELIRCIEKAGYIPVILSWHVEKSMSSAQGARERADSYQLALEQRFCNPKWTVDVTSCLESHYRKRFKWHFDSPLKGNSPIQGQALGISGWVIDTFAQEPEPLQLYIKTAAEIKVSPFTVGRKDALNHVYGGDAPPGYAGLRCGFSTRIDFDDFLQGVEVGIVSKGDRIPFIKVTNSSASKSIFESLKEKVSRGLK
ncbi:methyltransferase domain-containing protein [Nitrincola sp. MINF-07-Sa-05]|uniref:methyltransferase domain-containing protein n=1 Tax=Nitrincola salilacus TaxID=3400273 RepID=UPI003917D0B5